VTLQDQKMNSLEEKHQKNKNKNKKYLKKITVFHFWSCELAKNEKKIPRLKKKEEKKTFIF
jgi:hypothetical protein